GERTDIFSRGGGRILAEERSLPFLGEIPLDPRIRTGGGDGQPLVAATPDAPEAAVFQRVAALLAAQISQANFRTQAGPVMPSGPRLPVR
ncbi:MAG TPA: P-loop NTPase, partial [Candidatus Dormibacteraeota bacterium]|nr:P-loop NTPase [Candidatus Dormibacteraeota bacterium]